MDSLFSEYLLDVLMQNSSDLLYSCGSNKVVFFFF